MLFTLGGLVLMVPGAGCWTWELPQTLLGAMLYAVQHMRGRMYAVERTRDGRCLVETTGIGISLGGYVYWSRKDAFGNPFDVRLIRAHELGHTVQSRALGWLYLPTVGVASGSRALFSMSYFKRYGRPWGRYFDAWPESAADAHGGIVRNAAGRRELPPGGSPLDPHPPVD
ncbi:MAG: hypothetical protein CL927_15780 [Deltaproteobacteria bacterium]|nr:hypothetical protein [Deltaproteobacteria bacterium]